MKQYIITMESCAACPNYEKGNTNKETDTCLATDKNIIDIYEIPDWCPLDDY